MDKRNQSINCVDLIVGGIGLLTGLLIYFVVIPQTIREPVMRAWRGHSLAQSAKFMPRMWTILWIITSSFILIQSILPRFIKLASTEEKTPSKDLHLEWKETALTITVLFFVILAFILSFQHIGYLVAAPLFLGVSLFWFKIDNPVKILFLTILLTLLVYLFFTKVLQISIPLI